jgi:hypothetical protein
VTFEVSEWRFNSPYLPLVFCFIIAFNIFWDLHMLSILYYLNVLSVVSISCLQWKKHHLYGAICVTKSKLLRKKHTASDAQLFASIWGYLIWISIRIPCSLQDSCYNSSLPCRTPLFLSLLHNSTCIKELLLLSLCSVSNCALHVNTCHLHVSLDQNWPTSHTHQLFKDPSQRLRS